MIIQPQKRYCRWQPAGRVTTYFFRLLNLCSLLAFAAISLRATGQTTPKTEPLILRSEPLPFTPGPFYIETVIDERENRTAIALLLVTNNPAQAAKPVSIDLQGGGLTAIRQFFRQSIQPDKKRWPITVRLKDCRIIESAGANGQVNGQVVLSMAFDVQRDGSTLHLVNYRGGTKYSRTVNQLAAVEPTFRYSLVGALQFLNNWMGREAEQNVKLAREIKVSFTDYTRNAADDTLFYASRPLAWNDFQGVPPVQSRFAATVFPSFAYEGQSEVVKGVLHINLSLKTYVLRSSSWVKDAARDAYGLNHEQRHFDIVKMVTERFKEKIQPGSLTVEDYNSIIQYQYLEAFREMNRLQEQYDSETGHGINKVAQAQWNQKIDQELSLVSGNK